MIRFLRHWYYRRLRKLDLDIMWPICKEKAIDLDHAKAAFAYHAFHDRAWLVLGEEGIAVEIARLT